MKSSIDVDRTMRSILKATENCGSMLSAPQALAIRDVIANGRTVACAEGQSTKKDVEFWPSNGRGVYTVHRARKGREPRKGTFRHAAYIEISKLREDVEYTQQQIVQAFDRMRRIHPEHKTGNASLANMLKRKGVLKRI